MAQGPEIEVLGKAELKICKITGVSKSSGQPYTMLGFKYMDPYLNKEVSLQPSLASDRAKLELMYVQGWIPPTL